MASMQVWDATSGGHVFIYRGHSDARKQKDLMSPLCRTFFRTGKEVQTPHYPSACLRFLRTSAKRARMSL
jgi:hypothetical protein